MYWLVMECMCTVQQTLECSDKSISVFKAGKSQELSLFQLKLMKYKPRKAPSLLACTFSRPAKPAEKSHTSVWTTDFSLAWPTFIKATHSPSSSEQFPSSLRQDRSLASLRTLLDTKGAPFSGQRTIKVKGEQKGETCVLSTASPVFYFLT